MNSHDHLITKSSRRPKIVVRLSFLCRKSTRHSVDVAPGWINNRHAKPWCLVIRNLRSNIRAFERHEDVGLENQESWELLWNNSRWTWSEPCRSKEESLLLHVHRTALSCHAAYRIGPRVWISCTDTFVQRRTCGLFPQNPPLACNIDVA